MPLNDPTPSTLRSLCWAFVATCLALSTPVAGQEDADDQEQAVEDAAEAGETQDEEEEASTPATAAGPVEEVVVTGSRLKRNQYTSITPLQIINAEVQREAGLIDPGDILQESSTASGLQVDLTFQGLVLDDGPSARTINLRGLGANRTLLLINGRRVAPGGVEGAPSSPSLNVIPGLLVSQYDQLLDGASSIYGSDAIAGVTNAILRKDFDGFELQTFNDVAYHGGADQTYGATWGRNFDRGFIGVGAQWTDERPVTFADRPWTNHCARHSEIDQSGARRHQDVYYSSVFGMRWNDCALGSLAGRVYIQDSRAGSIYHTQGYSNGGWPNFSESSWAADNRWQDQGVRAPAFGVDGDGDGETDISFLDYTTNGRDLHAHLFPDVETANFMAYGEYTFESEMNLTTFFEVGWSTLDYFLTADEGALLFPDVPPNSPYNLCNPNAVNGVDCGLATDAMFQNPAFVEQFSTSREGICALFGFPKAACTPALFGLVSGPIGPTWTYPIVRVRGDRNLNGVEREQGRLVLGVSGDMPFLNVGPLNDWSFELSLTHSESTGKSWRYGVREDRLWYGLGAYSYENVPCEKNIPDQVIEEGFSWGFNTLILPGSDALEGCVPVNMFAPSLYTGVIGEFGSAAEQNYLFDTRDFDTTRDQTIAAYYMTGNAFSLPGGPILAGFGLEYRYDEIDSIPDEVAREGLFFGYFADGGAVGDKTTQEAFGEVELPILTVPNEITLNLSARWTDDEYYGGAWTGSGKLGWRPVDWLLDPCHIRHVVSSAEPTRALLARSDGVPERVRPLLRSRSRPRRRRQLHSRGGSPGSTRA